MLFRLRDGSTETCVCSIHKHNDKSLYFQAEQLTYTRNESVEGIFANGKFIEIFCVSIRTKISTTLSSQTKVCQISR